MNTTTQLITVIGATGNIGHRLVENLLKKGKKVRAVGRNPEKLKSFGAKGAEIFIGDVENQNDMNQALAGSTAAFLMIPPNYAALDMRGFQNKISQIFEKAIVTSGIKYIVNLSSFGAHLSEKTGPILGLYDHENRINKIPNVNIFHLRPAYFMENLLVNVGLIKSMGIMGSPLDPNVPTPMIATQDIADVATEELLSLSFSGKSSRELLGPREVTLKEVAKAIGKSIGKPDLSYVQFPYEDAEKAMTQMGLSDDAAKKMVELQKNINEGFLKPVEPRSSRNTTPTTIDEFAKSIFAPAFSSGTVAAAH